MNLFNNDKDIIHRIINLVLIIWVVIAIFIFYSSFVDVILKMPVMTYTEYEAKHCGTDLPKRNDEERSDEYCERAYDNYKITDKRGNFTTKHRLLSSLGNVVIVGFSLFFINNKKAIKKPKGK